MEFHCVTVTSLTNSVLYLTKKYIIKIAVLHIAGCFISDIFTIAKKTVRGEKEEKRKKKKKKKVKLPCSSIDTC